MNLKVFKKNLNRMNCLLFSADAWPQVFDDSDARRDWQWHHKYDLEKLVDLMVRDVKNNYISNGNGNDNGGYL